MKKWFILIALLIVGLLFVPAVSAEKVIWDYTAYEFTDTSGYTEKGSTSGGDITTTTTQIYMLDISLYQTLGYIVVTIPSTNVGYTDNGELLDPGRHEFTYALPDQDEKLLIVYVDRYSESTRFTLFFEDWDIEDLSGRQEINLYGMYFTKGTGERVFPNQAPVTEHPIMITVYTGYYGYFIPSLPVRVDWASGVEWQNHIYLKELDPNPLGGYEFSLTRIIDGKHHQSDCKVYKDEEVIFSDSSTTDIKDRWFSLGSITQINVTSPTGRVYKFPVTGGADPDTPLPTRTGTVTMTDHNGTTISNFEVKAVNYYTGEEYTVSTNTDVATITLPMDRTIALRNPQTGQYEDVPVGYYTFFVSKPGYKMTSEDGVRISVMPVEYSSYHLGDIIVTSEDGYLTGKHQFQIRSRADLSILQTGTISAQSATTGEWYNTTVVDGIATLILPYDTSNPYYEYVGNYYVYATSPGYIPSEYATQISVRPDTQSEIRYILLTPIGGIPEPGNVTLRIQAVSDSGQGIPNAQIHIDGLAGAGWEVWESYTASATGYAEISVYENSTYDITVYGEGYYSSSQRIEVGDTDPPLIEFKLYPTAPALTPPTTQPTGWVTPPPTTKPPGIPDEDDDSEGFLMEAIRGISKAFGVGFATGKTIFGMLLALAIGFATAKQLRGGAAEFGLGLLGGTMLGVLIGLLPVWVVVVLLLIVGMYIGYRYVGGSSNG